MTRHCVACGTPLPAERPHRCPDCGTVDWRNAKPCAAAVVVHDGAVLLARRAHAPWRGLGCAPSGFCDGPEHPVAAAEREALEEVGLAVRVVGYLGTWVDPYADDPDDGAEHVSVQYYAAEPTGATDPTVDPAEVTEARWFPLDALPAGLAPPGTLAAALAALARALADGGAATPLPDRPTGLQGADPRCYPVSTGSDGSCDHSCHDPAKFRA